jgi:WD40 repeat protein
MPRPERPLDPGGGVVQRLAADLRALRERAGSPGYRELARRAHFSATTLSDAAGGQKLPSLAVTVAYARACGGDQEEWEARWRAVAAEELAPTELEVGDGETGAPYVGLTTFQPEDADRFFGREELVDEVVNFLTERRFMSVFGPSGSGKSSLLRAGVIPAVSQRSADNGHLWPTVLFTPGERPLDECATHLARLLGIPAGSVLADLTDDPRYLHLAIRQSLVDQPDEVDLLLVVDQFEEVFTLCQDTGQRSQFIAALLAAAFALTSRVRVVLGIRADFYSRCAEHPDLVEALRDGQILVGPMQAEQLRAAITRPAVRASLMVETALVSTIVSEMVGRPGALPLMSHALVETWRRRRGCTLTLADYEATGGVEGALTQTAERAYTSLNAEERHAAREVFLRLTALGEGTEDTRRRILTTELDHQDPVTTVVLETLARARLLTLGENTIEIAHETLIRSWPRLRGWLTDNRDDLRIHRQLTEATQTWEGLSRDPGALYRGLQLATAREWCTRRRTRLTSGEQQFLDASIAAQTCEYHTRQRRARRLWILTVSLAIVACLSAATSVIAVYQRQDAATQRTLALSRELAAKANAVAVAQPGASIRLAIAAFLQAPTTEARSALLTAQGQPFIARLAGHTGAINAVAFSPDGRVLATAGNDGATTLWDVAIYQETATLTRHTGPIHGIAFSPDGHTLATAGNDGTATLWDVSSHQETTTLTGHTGPIHGIAFSPDGRTLATAGDDGTMLWNVTTHQEITTLTNHTGPIHGIAFSPDGRTLATAGNDGTMLWNVTTHQEITTLTNHTGPIHGIAFSPDGHTLATAGNDGTATLWDVPSHQETTTLTGHTGAIHGIAFSPDGHTLATTSGDINLWDTTSRREITTLIGHLGTILAVAFSADGHTFATASEDHTVAMWDLNGRTLTSYPLSAHPHMAFSPDGRTLATAGDGGTVLWDVATHQEITTLTNHTGAMNAVAFSPDGHTLATAGDGGTVLWDVATHQEITTLTNHTGAMNAVAFSPDGHTLATGSYDGTTTLWDVATHQETATLTRHTGPIHGIAFSPDGHTLATAGNDGSVRLWDLDVDNVIKYLCQVISGGITRPRPNEAKIIPDEPSQSICR